MTMSTCCGAPFGPWLILRAIGSALQPGRLLLAMFCLSILVGSGHLWDAIVGDWVPSMSGQAASSGPFAYAQAQVIHGLDVIRIGVTQFEATTIITGIVALTWDVPAALWGHGAYWFVLVYGTWAVIILSLSFGVQSRYEAILVAERQSPSSDRLIEECGMLGSAFAGAWLVPLVMSACLALLIMVCSSVLLSIPVLNVLGGVVWGVVLLLSLALALLLLAMGVGGALLVPTVAVDGCHGTDAMHRAFACVTAEPLRWLGHVALLAIGLGLGMLLVQTVLFFTSSLATALGGVLVVGDAMVVADAATDAVDPSWSAGTAGGIVAFWLGLLNWVFAGWVLCFLAGATTRAWMLLRQAGDGVSPEDIWRPGLMRGTLAPLPDCSGDSIDE
jgi:hypothetical protein